MEPLADDIEQPVHRHLFDQNLRDLVVQRLALVEVRLLGRLREDPVHLLVAVTGGVGIRLLLDVVADVQAADADRRVDLVARPVQRHVEVPGRDPLAPGGETGHRLLVHLDADVLERLRDVLAGNRIEVGPERLADVDQPELEANPVVVGGVARLVEQRVGLVDVVGIARDVRVVEDVGERQRTLRGLGITGVQHVGDIGAIDAVGNRLTDRLVAQRTLSIVELQHDGAARDALHLREREMVDFLEFVDVGEAHDAARVGNLELVPLQPDSPRRLVLHQFVDDLVEMGQTLDEMVRVPFDDVVLVRLEFLEDERTGADRILVRRVLHEVAFAVDVLRHDRQLARRRRGHQKRAVAFREAEDDGVVIGCLHLLHRTEHLRPETVKLLDESQREGHVGGGHRLAVVKRRVLRQVEGVGQSVVRDRIRFGEVGYGTVVLVQSDEAREDLGRHQPDLERGVQRIEAWNVARQVRHGAALLLGAGRHRGQRQECRRQQRRSVRAHASQGASTCNCASHQ